MLVRPKPSVAFTRSSPRGASRRLLTRFFHGADIVEDPRGLRQIELALAGQADAARAAVGQAHAQPLFHQHQAPGCGGWRDAEFARAGGQAAELRQQDKEFDVVFHLK
jgi:hypothetical protein